MKRVKSRSFFGPVMLITVVAAALVIFGMLYFGSRFLPFNLFPGYEGSYMIFAGYSANFPTQIQGKVGDSPPPGSSQWIMTPSYLNIDPDGPTSGVQNLIAGGLVYSSRIETTALNVPVSDGPVRWTVTHDLGARVLMKTYEARVYYFTHHFFLTTRWDEDYRAGFGSTEKGCPVRDATILLQASVVNWDPRGNNANETRVWILAVEVTDVKIYRTDNTGSGVKFSEGLPDGATASLGVAKGQTLPLASTPDSLIPNVGVPGRQYIEELRQMKPSEVSSAADPRLRDVAYVPISITELGAKGGSCNMLPILGVLNVANNPMVEVTLRVHVLKVDSWVAVRTKGANYEPPLPPGVTCDNVFTCAWERIANWFAETFGLPLQIAGYVLIAMLLFFMFIVLMIVAVAITARLEVRRALRNSRF